MSRGRAGPSKEHYCRHPPPRLQAKESYRRPGPAPFPPEQFPNPSYYNSPARPAQPPAPLLPSAPPVPNHFNVVPGPVTFDYAQNYGGSPVPNSFHFKQAEFLRGQISEAPQFGVSSRGRGGVSSWPPSSSYQPQSGYSRYPNPSSNPRGKRGHSFSQNKSFAYSPGTEASRGATAPRHLNQNQPQGKNNSSNRQGCAQTGSLCDNFRSLALQQDRSSRRGFDRHPSSSSSARKKINITFTHEIQDRVHRALAALKPGESVPAKVLARKIDLPKKIVNKALYSLEASQKAFKQGLTPPKWTLFSGALRAEENLTSETKSHPLRQPLDTQQARNAEAKVDAETENKAEEEDSDTDSSSSYSSSLELADSEEFQPPAEERPGTSSSADQELNFPVMADQKEQILQYLLESGETTALIIAKNLGLKNTKQATHILTALEKQGDVVRNNDFASLKWELSPHRKEKMERSLKIAQSTAALGGQMEVEVKREENSGGSIFLSSPLPPVPGLEPLPLLEDWMQEQRQNSTQPPITSTKDVIVEEQWATDDIPEFLNAIRRETDALKMAEQKTNIVGTVAVSVPAAPPQNLWAKLQEVRLKNPVSGLMEYAQYLGQNCEFLLLDQSGPSHDPRFRMQVMLNGRLFPVTEASSKKVAKKDAAAATLRLLMSEMQGGTGASDEGNSATVDQMLDLDTVSSVENTSGTFGPSSAEGTAEGPRQPLSRSLPGGKNPVSVLMEYSQRSGNPIEFINTGQAGPPHDPRFMFRVKVGEILFSEASAPSKKAARQLAAEEAVKELMADGKLQLSKPQLPLIPSCDDDGSASKTPCPSLPPLTENELRAAHEAGVGDLINHLNNNAVSGLLEYARARGFAAEIRLVSQSGPPHEPKFTYQAKLGGRWFPPVCASNKKQGKQEAADAALRVLIGEAEKAARTGELIPTELPVSGSTLHDQIAMLSHQRFNALTTRIQHSLLGRKILATIVMRKGEGLGTVVSLGTGNRCVKGEELSLKGETVNDCHAEIISRRGFIRFLYSELLRHYDGADDSIFEPAEDGKLKIKSDITFHLYISTAPCGDGALFDKSCSETGDEAQGHQPLFENAKQGKLRTKVENGEGTIPVESSAIVPTWDGIQHGERLRTMSCSDKILRWNVLGLQGALLSYFLHPIYLKSITLGYLYSHGHLTRAVCCRLARDSEAFSSSLPPSFRLNHPEVGRVSVYDSTRHTGKTKESSVNWCLQDQHNVEVLDGTKGKLDGYVAATATHCCLVRL
ncbi:double-stranded RNA-specific adenosine deaminase isoform X2 [Kryptolebias marmoratus]|uniref:Adenosine deaminase RNA specific n=1 Tax=Kryptolebias marmoratus TaxID=37003 RepID=A0A3Q2ZGF8_KRYMA|nr:double-stranded RNA-specific adenosine deaminase isoform X2 [Kryptolebias marmoratus]